MLAAILSEAGWEEVPLSPPRSVEVDPSIWTVFTKKSGEEDLLIRFPGEPYYRYFPGGWEACSGAYSLQVRTWSGFSGEVEVELEEGTYEKWIGRGETLYILRGSGVEKGEFDTFASSFFVGNP